MVRVYVHIRKEIRSRAPKQFSSARGILIKAASLDGDCLHFPVSSGNSRCERNCCSMRLTKNDLRSSRCAVNRLKAKLLIGDLHCKKHVFYEQSTFLIDLL